MSILIGTGIRCRKRDSYLSFSAAADTILTLELILTWLVFMNLKTAIKALFRHWETCTVIFQMLLIFAWITIDRTGDSEHGENLRINGNKIAMIKRILVFTFIYEGITSWKQADAKVTISYPGAEDIIVNMDEYDTQLTTCGLLFLENVNDQTFSIEKIVKFYQGHIALDKAFNWGITWGKPARK